jgi:hypothetical protein
MGVLVVRETTTMQVHHASANLRKREVGMTLHIIVMVVTVIVTLTLTKFLI